MSLNESDESDVERRFNRVNLARQCRYLSIASLPSLCVTKANPVNLSCQDFSIFAYERLHTTPRSTKSNSTRLFNVLVR